MQKVKMMSNKIVLSVIIPVYNVEKYLRKCLETVFYPNNEVQFIIINDGSTDDSQAIIKKFVEIHKNVLIINQENMGLPAARNSGIKVADGEWIYFVDSDDYVDYRFVENIYKSLKSNIQYNLISLPVMKLLNSKRRIMQDGSCVLSRDEYIKLLILGKRQFGVWSCVFKKEIISKYNISFEKDKLFEDQYFVPNYLKHVSEVLHFNSKKVGFYYYRFRSGSITHSSVSKDRIKQKLEAEWSRDSYLKQLTSNSGLKKLINTNKLTLLYRAYINSLRINDVHNAENIKKKYFSILVDEKHTLRWKEIIKTIIMIFPMSMVKKNSGD